MPDQSKYENNFLEENINISLLIPLWHIKYFKNILKAGVSHRAWNVLSGEIIQGRN